MDCRVGAITSIHIKKIARSVFKVRFERLAIEAPTCGHPTEVQPGNHAFGARHGADSKCCNVIAQRCKLWFTCAHCAKEQQSLCCSPVESLARLFAKSIGPQGIQESIKVRLAMVHQCEDSFDALTRLACETTAGDERCPRQLVLLGLPSCFDI